MSVTAGELLDDVAVRDADHDLVVAGLLDVAADRHHARPFRLLGPARRVFGAAVADDPGHSRQRLDVVDRGRLSPRAFDGGEWGTGARLGALALEGLEQCCLLAADIRPVAAVQPDIERVAGPKRMGAEVALGVGFGARL